MRILLTNDDGVHSSGLLAAAKALKPLGEVIIVAPDREQSGVGSAISMSKPISMTEITPILDGIETFAVDATPADCMILAIESLIKDPIDLVISGINQGANLGHDIFISGTIGAALQGFLHGIPSVAVSVVALLNPKFDAAEKIIKSVVEAHMNSELPPSFMLNINVPNLPIEEIRGTAITRLGEKIYGDVVTKYNNGKKDYFWISRSKQSWEPLPGQDISAINEKFVSITPLHLDLTSDKDSKKLSDTLGRNVLEFR